jgi:ureidoglycolate dehydrogenase (NAD+)
LRACSLLGLIGEDLAYDIFRLDQHPFDLRILVAPTSRTIPLPRLEAFCSTAFERVGLSPTDAATGARVLATTDGWGVFTHGSKALRGYLRRLQAGGLRPQGRPGISTEGPSWALVDGYSSLGMVTSVFAMDLAIAKAKETGVAYVGVHNSCHFGAAGYYAAQAARQGVIALSMANDIPSVAAPGSRGAITGSNPFAYAVPAGRHDPIVLDMSIATVAGGKVYAAKERGEPISPGWLIGENGLPTVDPDFYPERSTLTPAAGHKGYGLGLMIEALAGALTGAAMTWQVRSWLGGDLTTPTGHGAAFVVIDATTIHPDLPARVERLVDEIHAAPRADGVDRLYVPGEMEWERYAAAERDGVRLPSDVVHSLQESAELVGLDLADFELGPQVTA